MKKADKNPKIHRQKTYDLTVTKYELLHIRDLFSVLLPPDGSQTLSQALAEAEGRGIIESMLWEKVSSLCEAADLPLGAESPDYIIAPVSSPALGVFHLNHDVDQPVSAEGEGFLPNDSSEEEVEEEDE